MLDKTQLNNLFKACTISSLALMALMLQAGLGQLPKDVYFHSVYYLLCCVLIGVFSLFSFKNEEFKVENKYLKYAFYAAKIIVLVLAFSNFYNGVYKEITQHPINYQEADMLPVLQTMAQRFIKGENIYATIPEIWGGMDPVYLPAMWLPYVPAMWFKFDPRWVNFALVFIAFTLIIYQCRSIFNLAIIGILLHYLWHYVFINYPQFFRFTEEGLICFYYVLLIFTLYKRWTYGALFATALCLFSRYWLAPWLFIFIFYFFISFKIKDLIKPALAFTAFCVFFLFLIPIEKLIWILQLPQHYLKAITDHHNDFKYDEVIRRYGLIKYFKYEERYLILRYASLIFCLIILVSVIFYKKLRGSWFNGVAVGLLIIIISIAIHSGLIPYEYLFLPLLMMTFMAVANATFTNFSFIKKYID